MIRHILILVLAVLSIPLIILVVLQEAKSGGMGSTITGLSTSYMSKNKGRTKEGRMVRLTAILLAALFVLSIVIQLAIWG